jgi:hypothetical protein
MSDDNQARAGVTELLQHAQPHQPRPARIANLRDFRQRRERNVECRSVPSRSRRTDDEALLRQKRALADQLFALCEQASEAVRERGGAVADDLERIAELSLIVSYWDAETGPQIEMTRTVSRLEDSRDFLAAMALASDIARLVPSRA